DSGVACPQDDPEAGARGDRGQCTPPCPAADDREPLHRVSLAGPGEASSGQRGCTGASSPSVRPRRRRSSPAQAIIAPLSVQSSTGGATKVSPADAPSAARRSPSRRLAAPPPAATRVVPLGWWRRNQAIALAVRSTSE